MAGERRARGRQDGPGLKGRRDHARWIGLFTICSSEPENDMTLRGANMRSSTRRRQEPPSRQTPVRRLSLHSLFVPACPVWHAAHLRVSHIQGLHPCVPSPPRHNALAAAHRPRALASALRLQPRCVQSAPLASPHLPPPLVQVMILGSLTTFSLAFSMPVPRLSSSTTRGASF